MSTAYDLTKAPNANYPIAYNTMGSYTRRHVFDVAVDLPTVTAGDTAKIFNIAAGEFVKNVYIRNITASTTGSSTLEVGDSASATGYNASVDATAAAGTIAGSNGANIFTQSGTTPFAVTWKGGKGYTAADYILITLGSTAPANGQFEVVAEIVPFSTSNL